MAGVESDGTPVATRRRRSRTTVNATGEAVVTAPAPVSPPKPRVIAIAADNLSKRFGDVTAVDGLSFEVPAGAVVGFVGPNGSGKTTTIRMLAGLIRPTAGTATVLGPPISSPASYLSEVGALIEEPAFYPKLDGYKNLLVHCKLRGIDPERIAATIAAVGLEDAARRNVEDYSLGMRKRLAIAAALLPNPKLLILDEPANGLDPIGIRDVRQLLRHLADQGRTVFVSSHLLAEVEQACDEVVMIQKGRLLYQGALTDLLNNEEAELVIAAESASQHRDLRKLCADAGYVAELRHDKVYVRAPSSFAGDLNRMAFEAGITLVELRRERVDLEKVFFNLTEDRQEVPA